MRPSSSEILANRPRKSSGAEMSTSPNPSNTSPQPDSTAPAGGSSPSMMTYFLASDSSMAAATANATSSQTGFTGGSSGHRRASLGTDDGEAPYASTIRRRRGSGNKSDQSRQQMHATDLNINSQKKLDPPIQTSSLAPGSLLSMLDQNSFGSGNNAVTFSREIMGGHDSEEDKSLENSEIDEDEDERSSNLSFPLSITDTLPPGSPARPIYGRNHSPGPSPVVAGMGGPGGLIMPTHSLAGTRNGSSKSLTESLDGGPDEEMVKRKEDNGGRRGLQVESLDSSTLSTQFIMPTIKMPSRRPFTARGKDVGRLKIMVAGDSGIGKSALIKSIIQANEDIVHVDQDTERSPTSSTSFSFNGSYSKLDGESTRSLKEIYASTKPYPTWWSEFEESRVLRRRKSGVDTVLERNLCFVDTPGYGAGTSYSECIEPVVKYVENQLERTTMILNGDEGDLLPFLSGNGSPQVDVVLYVILHRLKPVDIDFIRKLSALTNVHPIIARSDTLSHQQTIDLKLSILNDLRNAGVRAFLFGKSADDVARGLPSCPPFATSSAQSPDTENMDASLLMSPDYVPPLVPSELGSLIDELFDPENAAWLRHSSTKKFLSWKASHPAIHPSIIPNPSTSLSPSTSQLIRSSSPNHRPPINTPTSGSGASSFVLARVTDHTRREEHMAQLHLAKWAADLQKSLKAERDRYERLARGERAMWLTEKLGECVGEGTLIPTDRNGKMVVRAPTGETMAVEPVRMFGSRGYVTGKAGVDRRDPIGWVKLNTELKKGACLLLQVTGGFGVVGVIAVFLVKYAWGGEVPGWIPRFGI